jgi:hypothetical protein
MLPYVKNRHNTNFSEGCAWTIALIALSPIILVMMIERLIKGEGLYNKK